MAQLDFFCGLCTRYMRFTGYGMEISSDKSEILVNSIKPEPSTNIQMNWRTTEEADKFRHIGSAKTKEVNEVKIRLPGTSTLNHGNVRNTIGKQRHQFFYKV